MAHMIDVLRQLLVVKLLIISLASVIAPILSEKIKWIFVPSIVFELMLGIIIGPQILDLVQLDPRLNGLSTVGLIFLIFLAGLNIDLQKIRGRPLFLACISWLVSLLIALALVASMDLTLERGIIALALTTTALGALLPILQDSQNLVSKFGVFVLAMGAISQFAPIVIISLLFTEAKPEVTVLFLVFFITFTVISAVFVAKMKKWKSSQFISNHLNLSSQLPIRISIFLIFCLVCLAITLKLNVLMGAFSAGIIVQLFIAEKDRETVDSKLKAVGYSFIIPLFFIVSGLRFDIQTLASFDAISRVLFFFVCLLIVRAVPVFIFFRHEIEKVEQQALICFSATGLPLIVVMTHLGSMSGKILSVNAVALVGAGVLSVLIFPVLGLSRLKQKNFDCH
ncbi:MAG: cation:proton antiporter [Gammaproteobacteria bacterium]|nr:cation:proton antiporter [Gammaproteobacteria bacterium]